MLTYFAASKTVDFLIHGHRGIHGNDHHLGTQRRDSRRRSSAYLQRGVTVYKGRGGLSDTEQDILFCVVTRLEIGRVKTMVRELDDGAFIVVHPLADAEGGGAEAPSPERLTLGQSGGKPAFLTASMECWICCKACISFNWKYSQSGRRACPRCFWSAAVADGLCCNLNIECCPHLAFWLHLRWLTEAGQG